MLERAAVAHAPVRKSTNLGPNIMGAWGVGNFDNDTVLDWLGDVRTVKAVRDALQRILQLHSDDYLESDLCCEALGAAEIVAASGGFPSSSPPSDAALLARKLSTMLTPVDLSNAMAAVMRVEEKSELQQLFDEGRTNHDWHDELHQLVERLRMAT